ncbi:MAG: hypothetical protein ACPG2Y_02830 [Acholeplasmataceae bacterium]
MEQAFNSFFAPRQVNDNNPNHNDNNPVLDNISDSPVVHDNSKDQAQPDSDSSVASDARQWPDAQTDAIKQAWKPLINHDYANSNASIDWNPWSNELCMLLVHFDNFTQDLE